MRRYSFLNLELLAKVFRTAVPTALVYLLTTVSGVRRIGAARARVARASAPAAGVTWDSEVGGGGEGCLFEGFLSIRWSCSEHNWRYTVCNPEIH